MEINSNKWAFLERQLPGFIGLAEALGGFSLIAVASSLPHIFPSMSQWLPGTLSNLGIGLLAAGIATATIETISRKRLHQDIAEIKEAHFESVLKGIMPAPIFEEIDAHIIGESLLRKNLSWAFEFTWQDEERDYIHRNLEVFYEVENMSRASVNYEIILIEERTWENKFPEIGYIIELEIEREGKKEPDKYLKENLEDFIKVTEQYFEMNMPLVLEPNENIKVRFILENVLKSRDSYYCASAKISEDFELIVAHPADLIVEAMPFHPSRNKFLAQPIAPTLKRWRIKAGILPYQGIELSWRPKD